MGIFSVRHQGILANKKAAKLAALCSG